jgi:hypothetical protein
MGEPTRGRVHAEGKARFQSEIVADAEVNLADWDIQGRQLNIYKWRSFFSCNYCRSPLTVAAVR